MGARVQRFDPETGNYILIEVATGEVLGELPGVRRPGKPLASPFFDVEEIEPMEPRRPVDTGISDPLGEYR
jgi:hypothetical protein